MGLSSRSRSSIDTTTCDEDVLSPSQGGTRSIGDVELERRIQSGHHSTNTEVFSNPGRTKNEGGSDNNDRGRISKTTSRKIAKTDVDTRTDDVSLSSTRVHNDTTKKRGNTKLDTAIQKQRDFLNGFITN